MADYNNFAQKYSDSMGDKGDETHQVQIDPYIYRIVGDPKDKVICDLGCGNGYMARFFAGKGAEVYASDISIDLIDLAKANTQDLDIDYSIHGADDLSSYQSNFFDVVVMNMSIHYLGDLEKLFSEISRVLKPNGIFAFSTNHFFRPNGPYSEWVTGKINDKGTLFIKVTDYLEKRANKVLSGWDNQTTLTIFNHPLNELINGMSENNLLTFNVFEPEPIKSGQAFSEELQKSHHIPTFIIIGAKKVIV